MKAIFLDLLLFTFSLIAGLLLASMISYGFLYAVDAIDLISKTRLQSELSTLEINLLKVSQLTYTIGAFGGASAIFSFYKTGSFYQFYTDGKDNLNKNFLYLIPLLILFYPIVFFSSEINEMLNFPEKFKHIEALLLEKEEEAKWITKLLLEADSWWVLAFNLIMIGIAPAIFEEFLFRGCLQKSIHKSTGNIVVSIVISAFIFSAIHFQFYGFIPRFLLGAFLGWVFYVTGNIAYPILLHLVNNGTQVLLVFIVSKYNLSWDVYEAESLKLIPTLLSTLLFIILAGQFMYKYQNKNE